MKKLLIIVVMSIFCVSLGLAMGHNWGKKSGSDAYLGMFKAPTGKSFMMIARTGKHKIKAMGVYREMGTGMVCGWMAEGKIGTDGSVIMRYKHAHGTLARARVAKAPIVHKGIMRMKLLSNGNLQVTSIKSSDGNFVERNQVWTQTGDLD